jgi:hypothetical protein
MVFAAALGVALLVGPAWSSDPVAYITEIQRHGKGAAAVKRMGENATQPAQPLFVLRRGDEVHVSGDAHVVLLYHAGAGTQTVSRSNSPFIVDVPTPARSRDRLQIVIATVGQVFLNQQSTPVYRRMAVRSAESLTSVPVLVSPRRTRLFPGPVRFEWEGGAPGGYAVRVLGPQGVVWEQKDVRRPGLAYPADATPLVDGTAYTWEVQGANQPAQRTDFELITNAEARRIRDSLELLQRAAREGYSAGTVPLMRAAVLLDEGLYADARRELQAAAASNRGEPAYHLLLSYIYQRIGLAGHAGDAYERALSLSGLEAAASSH